ncbi:hypothetical protein HELRODRAFT_171902 [Helobdella robusta]|uniref:Apple domain-containing protein n=1 Tax=Helobdella robusta TaxID=6412 RepID=T1F4T3_HELRO|nr:hypothetical protein HELRODRAFT_171902 [Helobdella robusta]ESO04900.1 hypothetical protein HELRODRAFT_171902 [Helobdella robusta]
MYFMANIQLIFFVNEISAEIKWFHRSAEKNVDFCSCDPVIEDRSWSTFSFLEALMLCSMRCSQTASCVAYNFFNATNQCQLFNQTLNKFSVLPGCINYFKKDEERTEIIRPLTITVDNELVEFYVNGINVPIALNFPHAKDWNIPDTYNLIGKIKIIALMTYNYAFDGGFIASTADNYILTNLTWKCTMNYYDVFYINIIVARNCYRKLEDGDVSFCSCDQAIEDRISFLEALMLCSMRCSQTASCVAYNFFNATNQCQLFNQTLNKFSVLPGCQYYLKKDRRCTNTFLPFDSENSLTNKPLTITVNNELLEFYLNGKNIPVASNFPNAKMWNIADTYNMTGNVHVIALKTYNQGKRGGFIASTADNYILTNETWKCTMNYYDGWNKMNYNDSFWPATRVAPWPTASNYYPPLSSAAKWIVDSTDCSNCNIYCRKSLIDDEDEHGDDESEDNDDDDERNGVASFETLNELPIYYTAMTNEKTNNKFFFGRNMEAYFISSNIYFFGFNAFYVLS